MQSKGIGAGESPHEDDLRDQATVLRHVLALHPTNLTLPKLAAEVCENPDDFTEGDAVARAVRDLASAGLLRMDGIHLVPTQAALHLRPPEPCLRWPAASGENLARHRKRADLSQEELGLKASLHRTEISLLERGVRVPRVDTLVKLAGALEVQPSALLDGDLLATRSSFTPSPRSSFRVGRGTG
jgi:DNA-binding XRE family transcriptional regulator